MKEPNDTNDMIDDKADLTLEALLEQANKIVEQVNQRMGQDQRFFIAGNETRH